MYSPPGFRVLPGRFVEGPDLTSSLRLASNWCLLRSAVWIAILFLRLSRYGDNVSLAGDSFGHKIMIADVSCWTRSPIVGVSIEGAMKRNVSYNISCGWIIPGKISVQSSSIVTSGGPSGCSWRYFRRYLEPISFASEIVVDGTKFTDICNSRSQYIIVSRRRSSKRPSFGRWWRLGPANESRGNGGIFGVTWQLELQVSFLCWVSTADTQRTQFGSLRVILQITRPNRTSKSLELLKKICTGW